MTYRRASLDDCQLLAGLNAQLIQDERHRNPMTVTQLEKRMRRWLSSGEYMAILWEQNGECFAYALFEDGPDEVHLQQFLWCVIASTRRKML